MPKPKKIFRGSSLENDAPVGKKGTPSNEVTDNGNRQQRTIFSGSGNVYGGVLG